MKKKLFLLFIMAILSFGMIYLPVKADSGWDSSYDSGGWDSGGFDSGSSWDSDYSWGSGSIRGSSGSSSSAVVIAVIIIVIVIIVLSNKNNRPKSGGGPSSNISSNSNNYKEMDLEKIRLIDPEINILEFKTRVFNIYKDIQIAWMNFDTDTIRKLTTDEIYNMYSTQLETLKIKKQRNIMKNITLDDVKIIDIKKENDVISVSVYLKVKCFDYVIKEEDETVVRGRKDKRLCIEYVLTFVKSSNNSKNIEKCPNCGAPVDIVSSSTCPYCDSTLVKDASDYVMSKKTCVGQNIVR